MTATSLSAIEGTAATAAAIAVQFAFQGQFIEAVVLFGIAGSLFLVYHLLEQRELAALEEQIIDALADTDESDLEAIAEDVGDAVDDAIGEEGDSRYS